MGQYRIVLLPGDGIGPEIMRATAEVLRAVERDGLRLELVEHEAGSELYRRTGTALPDEVLADCLDANAVLLAAIGLPDVRLEDGTEVQPTMMMGLRRSMDVFAAVRPIRLYPGVPSPLADTSRGIDFIVLRENLEGLFTSFGGGYVLGDDVAGDSLVITRRGTERVVECAFELARRRSERNGRAPKVTCVDKANIFRSFAFFRKVFFEVASNFDDVEAEAVYVDAMSLYLVQQPHAYDVLVMENQFGDILSDLGAALVGGLGMAPSAEIGLDRGLFQPAHGTAPDIAGKGIANPLALILSAAMMLDWLGERHDDPVANVAGRDIEQAVERLLAEGRIRTRDIGGDARTDDIGDAVARLCAKGS